MARVAEHGSRSKYVMGCRCEPCKKANRDYQRDWMWIRYGQDHPLVVRQKKS